MDDDSKRSVWISALQIVLGIAVIIGAVGFALWYANQRPAHSPALEQAVEVVRQKSTGNRVSREDSWGIVHDNPLRRR